MAGCLVGNVCFFVGDARPPGAGEGPHVLSGDSEEDCPKPRGSQTGVPVCVCMHMACTYILLMK